jgi:hypothetical protein
MDEYQVWLKNKVSNTFNVYNSKTKKCEIVMELPKNINSFYMLKYSNVYKKYKNNFTTNKDDYEINVNEDLDFRKILKKYSKELLESRNEILNCKALNKRSMKYDVLIGQNNKYKSFNILPKVFFGYCSNHYKYTEKLEPITFEEYNWFEKSYNGGMLYTVKNEIIDNCYGYDFKNCYGSIMGHPESEFKISEKDGLLKQILTLPKNPQYGFYKCKITSTNLSFNKFFHFNINNIYTHYDIKTVRLFQLKFKNVNIELILDEPNAYVYESNKLIKSNKIFGKWFNIITDMKKELTGNCFIKFLSSSLWGFLSKKNIKIVSEDEFFEMEDDVEIMDIFTRKDGLLKYKIIELNKPIYNTNFRLKPFITSYARHKMFKVIYDNDLFDSVLRVHTDSVVLDRTFDFSNQYNNELIPEDKTTGKIEFININNYNLLI